MGQYINIINIVLLPTLLNIIISSLLFIWLAGRCIFGLMSRNPVIDRRNQLVYDCKKVKGQNKYIPYRIESEIGRGAFASCYRTVRTTDQKVFAMKIMSHTPQSKHHHRHLIRDRIKMQVEIVSMLDSPYVVRYETHFQDSTTTYLVMQLCHNGSLAHVLKNRQILTEPQVRYITVQILNGLLYLRSRNILHHDIKVGNLLLDSQFKLKIGDFGLAVIFDRMNKRQVCGTPNYIAPQMLINKSGVFESDLWSAGVVVYILLFGVAPFETKKLQDTYAKIKVADYSFQSKFDIVVSQRAKSFISSILVLDPTKRLSIQQLLCHPFLTCYEIPSHVENNFLQSLPSTNYLRMYSKKKAIRKRVEEIINVQQKQAQYLEIVNIVDACLTKQSDAKKIPFEELSIITPKSKSQSSIKEQRQTQKQLDQNHQGIDNCSEQKIQEKQPQQSQYNSVENEKEGYVKDINNQQNNIENMKISVSMQGSFSSISINILTNIHEEMTIIKQQSNEQSPIDIVNNKRSRPSLSDIEARVQPQLCKKKISQHYQQPQSNIKQQQQLCTQVQTNRLQNVTLRRRKIFELVRTQEHNRYLSQNLIKVMGWKNNANGAFYILNNKEVGVLFEDKTIMLMSSNQRYLYYTFFANKTKVKKFIDLQVDQCSQIAKKVNLLKQYKKRLDKQFTFNALEVKNLSNLYSNSSTYKKVVYIRHVSFKQDITLFTFSNENIQASFSRNEFIHLSINNLLLIHSNHQAEQHFKYPIKLQQMPEFIIPKVIAFCATYAQQYQRRFGVLFNFMNIFQDSQKSEVNKAMTNFDNIRVYQLP